MSEKYTTLKSESLKRDGKYPFSADKIRILRRNEDGFTVLQIRLANNSDKVIVNGIINILCLPSEKVIQKVYSDFSAAKDEFFGTKVPVVAGNDPVESVEISVVEAVFEDGTVWTAEPFDTETETEESVPEESILSGENPVSAEKDIGKTADVPEAETVPKAEQIPEASAAAEKIPLLKKIGKNRLIAGACGAAVIAIIIAVAALGGKDNSGEIVRETENSVTSTSMTEAASAAVTETTVTEITTASETTAITTSETTETTMFEVTQQSLQNVSSEEKTFDFDGGYINYIEYKYYNSDGWEERVGFSADVNINDYPYAGTAINRAISNIVPPPSEYDLENSLSDPDPDALQTSMIGGEYDQISNVYAEGDALFITIYHFWSTGGQSVASRYGYSHSYVFDMRTGEEINIKEIFQDFERFKQDAVYSADRYIKENVPYEVYSIENYYEKLLNSTWYDDHSWKFDGDIFTVDFGPVFQETFYWAFTNIEVPIKITSDQDGASGDDYDGYYEVYRYGYVNIDSGALNVREEPSASAQKIGALAKNAEVYVYFYTDGWYYIYYEKNDLYGYVSSEFIELN